MSSEIEDPNYHFKQTREDHDLMVRIDEQVKGLVVAVREVRDNFAVRMASAEKRIDEAEKEIASARFGVKVAYSILSLAIIPLVIYIWNTRDSDFAERVVKVLDERYTIQIKE